MATITPNKTAGIAILALTAITHPDTVKGSAQDVSAKTGMATIILFHSSVEAVANTNAGTFYIQASGSASGDGNWATLAQVTATVSTADTEALTATEPIGETVMAVTSTTGFVATDHLYIKHTTLASSEFAKCQEIATNSSITLIDGLTTQQTAAASTLWNDCDVVPVQIDLTGITRIRVVFQHEGATGANCDVKALMVTGDTYTVV